MKVLLFVFSCVITLFLMYSMPSAQADTFYSRGYQKNHLAQAIDNHNLIAECHDCILCGKDIELIADDFYKGGDYNSATIYYKKALEIYKTSLSNDPSNRCVRNGLMRTQYKLKQILNK